MKSALRLVREVVTRRLNAQIGSASGPASGEIRMCQRLALIGEQQHDIASLGLSLAQLQPQTHAVDRLRVLPALQCVPGPSPAETPFLRSTLESCEREIVTPSQRATSPASRASVQFGLSATGADRSGLATRSAASALPKRCWSPSCVPAISS
jgi:hypothetical protein